VEESVGSHPVGWLDPVAALGVMRVDRHDANTTSPARVSAVLIDEEMLAVGQQERAEAPLTLVGGSDYALLYEPGEVSLRQVLSVRGSVAATPNEGVDRIPVRLAKCGECIPRSGPARWPASRMRLHCVVGND